MEFWRFATDDARLGEALHGSYSWPLVALSVAVAAFAALAALSVVDRLLVMRQRDGQPHWRWLSIGAGTMGAGIWAMHFTGMLAFRLPVTMSYDVAATLLSMLPAVLASGVGLQVMSRQSAGWKAPVIGGLFFAVGIGAMHFIGMEAMQLDAELRYQPGLFVLSIVVAYLLATTALSLHFVIRGHGTARTQRFMSAVVLGFAVAGMHYTAMGSSQFFAGGGGVTTSMTLPPVALAAAITAIVAVIAGLTIIGTIVDRRLMDASDSVVEAATRYSSVLDTMADAFIVTDLHGAIETFNPAAEAIFGRRAADVAGGRIDDLLVAGPGGWREIVDHYGRTGDAYLMSYGHPLQGVRADGTRFPIDVAVSRLTLPDKYYYACTLRDVTERRQLEDQLSQAQRLESIGRLAAGIAHEINTPTQYVGDNIRFLSEAFEQLGRPIALMQQAAELSEGRRASAAATSEQADDSELEFLLEEVPRAIDQSLEGVSRVAAIVQAMKEFSHPSSEKEQIDLHRALDSTISVATSEWKYVATIERDYAEGLPEAKVFPGELNQALLNIIVNAAHAIAETGVQEGDVKGTIRVTTRRDGDEVEIAIADTGCGMPEEVQAKIFDPFFTTKEIGRGTGQGLSVAHAVIVNRHGGSIAVDSTPGEGARFTIRLPAVAAPEPAPA